MGDDRFDAHREGELQRRPVGLKVGVFRRLAVRFGRPFRHLQPVQPFDADIAFPSRHEQTHRIALARPDALAVLVERDDHVVERLRDRDAADHARRVRAFRDHPFAARVEPGFVQQDRERHAGPFRAGQKPVERTARPLERLGQEAAPAIAGALQEMEMGRHRIAQQGVHIEHQRLAHQAVQDEPMLVGIDVGHAGVMALEMQPVRRDDAVHPLQGRQGHAEPGRDRIVGR